MSIFGFFGKILPWKRKDELGLKNNMALGGFGQADNQNFGLGGMDLGSPFPGNPGGMPQQFPNAGQQFGGMGGGGMGSMGGQMQSQPIEAFQSNQSYQQSYAAGKDIEVVSAKLDAIRAGLEALNQRLAAIERYIQNDQDFKKRGW